MSYQIYTLPQFPGVKVLVSLFTNVSNIDEIKQGVISLKQEYNYGFVNAANIISTEQLNSAIHKTLTTYQFAESEDNEKKRKKKLRTNSIYAEILLNLSPNANITDSLNRFGISKSSANLIVLKVYGLESLDNGGPQAVKNEQQTSDDLFKEDFEKIQKVISGSVVDSFSNEKLIGISDNKLIKKNYKLGATMIEDDREKLSDLLVGVIQLSDF